MFYAYQLAMLAECHLTVMLVQSKIWTLLILEGGVLISITCTKFVNRPQTNVFLNCCGGDHRQNMRCGHTAETGCENGLLAILSHPTSVAVENREWLL